MSGLPVDRSDATLHEPRVLERAQRGHVGREDPGRQTLEGPFGEESRGRLAQRLCAVAAAAALGRQGDAHFAGAFVHGTAHVANRLARAIDDDQE
jgi:hypothetical protein